MKDALPAALPGLPLVGNLAEFARDPLSFFGRLKRERGDVAPFSLGGSTRRVLVSHPDDVGRVLTGTGNNFSKGYQKDFSSRVVFGNGLATSEGSFWRRQRKLAAPAFHRGRIASYAGTMTRYAEEMVGGWEAGQSFDAHERMMLLSQRIVAKTLFGADVGSEGADLGRALDVILRETDAELRGVGRFLPHWLPTPSRSRLRAATGRVERVLNEIVGARRTGDAGHDDLLAMLMEARDDAGTPMTDGQLRDEVITLYVAGHETTANTLSWAWLLLSANPGARVELEAELRKVLDGRTPTLEDLTDLPYAEAVVKETLRLYPPAWTVYRVAEQDTEVGGYTIVAGTEVWTSQWVVHRDGRFFERPDAFVPERWLAGLENSLPRYAYFPFGGGPRICIGNRFAAVEAALVLCTVSQRFRPRALADDVTPEPSMTLRPKGGVPVYLERSAWG